MNVRIRVLSASRRWPEKQNQPPYNIFATVLDDLRGLGPEIAGLHFKHPVNTAPPCSA